MKTAAQLLERQRRLEQALTQARQQGAEVFAAQEQRLAQVERNTARIAELEAQMAAVLAALPKIKGDPIG